MKGQKLFVRAIEPADREAVRDFAERHGRSPDIPAGLLGKLVGELAAVLSMTIEPDAIRIVDLVVAEELRRKRVARVMLNELAATASSLGKQWLVADISQAEFLMHVGFVEERGVMKRRV